MLKDEIERTAREFIPHSASYCIPDLVKAILELFEKCVPEEKELPKAVIEQGKGYADNPDNYSNNDWLIRNKTIAEIKERIG